MEKVYIGVNIIKAEPCKAWKDMGTHKVGDDGYKVIYPDGYISWSPKEVFEETYHMTPMSVKKFDEKAKGLQKMVSEILFYW